VSTEVEIGDAENRPASATSTAGETPRKKGKPRGRPFAKGVSGNPGGRPKTVKEVQIYASQFTVEAIDVLVREMRGAADSKDRRQAAVAVLDRACGRPAQPLTGGDGDRLETEFPDMLTALMKIAGEKAASEGAGEG